MGVGLAEDNEGFFRKDAVDGVLELLANRDLMVLGPGMGMDGESVSFVQELLPQVDVPVVVDADGLNCIAENIEILEKVDVPLVMTPHPGEMARLMKCSTGEVQENREEIAREFAVKHNTILILKGYRSILADPGGQIWINPTGNPGMATAGSGDTLAGILGAFCARINHQNNDAWLLACLSALYIHGLAGDLAAEALTEEAMVARDIINFIPKSIQKIR